MKQRKGMQGEAASLQLPRISVHCRSLVLQELDIREAVCTTGAWCWRSCLFRRSLALEKLWCFQSQMLEELPVAQEIGTGMPVSCRSVPREHTATRKENPFLLQCLPTALYCPSVIVMRACSVVSASLRPHGLQPVRLFCPWGFPGKNTGVGCHFIVQGIFQGIEPTISCISCIGWQILYH